MIEMRYEILSKYAKNKQFKVDFDSGLVINLKTGKKILIDYPKPTYESGAYNKNAERFYYFQTFAKKNLDEVTVITPQSNGTHWTLKQEVINPKTQKASVLPVIDSMNRNVDGSVQTDGWSCGIHTMTNAANVADNLLGVEKTIEAAPTVAPEPVKKTVKSKPPVPVVYPTSMYTYQDVLAKTMELSKKEINVQQSDPEFAKAMQNSLQETSMAASDDVLNKSLTVSKKQANILNSLDYVDSLYVTVAKKQAELNKSFDTILATTVQKSTVETNFDISSTTKSVYDTLVQKDLPNNK